LKFTDAVLRKRLESGDIEMRSCEETYFLYVPELLSDYGLRFYRREFTKRLAKKIRKLGWMVIEKDG